MREKRDISKGVDYFEASVLATLQHSVYRYEFHSDAETVVLDSMKFLG